MAIEPDMLQGLTPGDFRSVAGTTGQSRSEGAVSGMALQAALALLGLGGGVVVLLCTSRYGIGTFVDSPYYLSAARSLLAGEGYRSWHGQVYMGWPPLYPTLLAATGIAGVDPQVGARWLHSLTFALIVFLSGLLFLRCTTSRVWALTGTLAVLASGPLLAWSLMVASEPLFIVLAILFVLCLPRALRGESLSALVVAALVAGLACLQRYAGVSLILAGLVLLVLRPYRVSLFHRLRDVTLFGVISVAPLALWCLRNLIVAEQTVGPQHRFHLPSSHELLRSFFAADQVVATWLFPWARAGSVRNLHLGLVIALAGTIVVLSHMVERRRRRSTDSSATDRRGRDTGGLQIWSATVVGLVYFGFLVVSAAGLGWVPEQRHLVPLYVFVMVLMVAAAAGASRLLSVPVGHRKMVDSLLVALCALWLQYPLRELVHSTAHYMREGAGGYSVATWQDSLLVQWLREHPLSGTVYSNGPDAVYLLAGAATLITPENLHDPAGLARWCGSAPSYVVWFHGLRRLWLYDLRELLSRYQMQEVATFPEGAVYRYLGAGGPAVSGVHRFWCAKTGRHLYTIRIEERDRLANEEDDTWTYEGLVFYAVPPGDRKPPNVLPVYALQSVRSGTCFYTMDEAEKERFVGDSAAGWTCKGVAFYAWPRADEKDLRPVHRFRSERLGSYFYTSDESERARLVAEFSPTWTYEGVAWYAYAPR
jgi:hypothetical protein